MTIAASHTKEPFKDLALENDVLRGASFSDCAFTKCRLANIDVTGVDFTDCTFVGCDISLPKLTNAGLHGVAFNGCKLMGADFSKCSTHFLRLSFSDCLIESCNFSALTLKHIPFLDCTIRESRFIESDLTDADFGGSDLEGTVIHRCTLEKADFSHAKNYAIDPTANKMKGARFSLPEAVSLLGGLGIVLR